MRRKKINDNKKKQNNRLVSLLGKVISSGGNIDDVVANDAFDLKDSGYSKNEIITKSRAMERGGGKGLFRRNSVGKEDEVIIVEQEHKPTGIRAIVSYFKTKNGVGDTVIAGGSSDPDKPATVHHVTNDEKSGLGTEQKFTNAERKQRDRSWRRLR